MNDRSWQLGEHVARRRGRMVWGPGFFTGQTGCFCCPAPSSYHIRQYENDSGMALLAQQPDNLLCYGLTWDGTNLVATYNNGSGPYTRAKNYDSTLATVETITNTYNWDSGGPSPGASRSAFRCGDGTYALTASRTAADNSSAVCSKNADNTLDWETNLEAFPTNGDGNCVVGDSSGNVYDWGYSFSDATAKLYKFNSSGVIQWRCNIADSPRMVTIASDGYIWCSGAANGKLSRVTTSGTASTIISGSATVDWLGDMESDGSGGVWVAYYNSSTPSSQIRRYDSSGTLLTTITESELYRTSGTIRFAIDSSNNVYGLCWSGSIYRVKKWNSSGTLQWTSGDIGWSSSVTPGAIAADSSYIFVGGQYVA